MNKVLIVHTWGIGDWISFTPVLKQLVTQYPQDQVDVLLGTPGTKIIVDYYPEVNVVGICDVRKGSWGMVYHALRLRRTKYDLLIFTAGVSSKKADLLSSLTRAECKVALRTTYHRPRFLSSWIDYDCKKHLVENNLELRKLIGLKLTEEVCTYIPLRKKGNTLPDGLLIHPGCDKANTYKRWPVERFVQVANKLLDMGRHISVILGPDELELNDFFSPLKKYELFRLLTNLNFTNLLDEISSHEHFLCSDSSLGHIAAALNRSVVAIYGPGDPVINRPYGAKTQILRTNMDLGCMPCMTPGGKNGCHERICLTDITVDRVIEVLESENIQNKCVE